MTSDGAKPQRTRIAAYGLVVSDDRVLLCRVSKQVPRWQGHWTLPGGGIEFGEDPESAMVREVEEETGLRVLATSIATIDSLHDDAWDLALHRLRIIYRTRCLGGTLRSETNGTTDSAAWFTRAETRALDLVEVAELGVRLVFDDK